MAKEVLVDDLTEVILKLEGGINMLVAGKHILADRRLVGVRDKLAAIRASVINGEYLKTNNDSGESS